MKLDFSSDTPLSYLFLESLMYGLVKEIHQ